MITVIATGFDGGRRRETGRHAASADTTDASRATRAPRERDFLEELERQRVQSADTSFEVPPADERSAAAATAAQPRIERTVGEPVPVKRAAAYDADDLEIPSFLRRK
jgi:hypothetical protein